MNFPDKCPFCGAGIVVMDDGEKLANNVCVSFTCATWIHESLDARRTQAYTCKEREHHNLITRVTELEARCKRLEHLGSNLRLCAGYLGSTASDDSDCITRAERACEAWDKEAKG